MSDFFRGGSSFQSVSVGGSCPLWRGTPVEEQREPDLQGADGAEVQTACSPLRWVLNNIAGRFERVSCMVYLPPGFLDFFTLFLHCFLHSLYKVCLHCLFFIVFFIIFFLSLFHGCFCSHIALFSKLFYFIVSAGMKQVALRYSPSRSTRFHINFGVIFPESIQPGAVPIASSFLHALYTIFLDDLFTWSFSKCFLLSRHSNPEWSSWVLFSHPLRERGHLGHFGRVQEKVRKPHPARTRRRRQRSGSHKRGGEAWGDGGHCEQVIGCIGLGTQVLVLSASEKFNGPFNFNGH